MARLGMGVVLADLALACATTAPVEKNAREFRYQVSNDVKQIEAGHWTGSWANRGVCLNNVGRKDEEAGVMTAEGTFDGVWTTPTELKSCTTKGKTTCTFQPVSKFLLWSALAWATGSPLGSLLALLLLWWAADRFTFRLLPDPLRAVARWRRRGALRRAIAVNPSDRRSRFELAQLLMEARRPAEAIEVLRPSLEAGDDDVHRLPLGGPAGPDRSPRAGGARARDRPRRRARLPARRDRPRAGHLPAGQRRPGRRARGAVPPGGGPPGHGAGPGPAGPGARRARGRGRRPIEISGNTGAMRDFAKVKSLMAEYGVPEGFVYNYDKDKWMKYRLDTGEDTRNPCFSDSMGVDLNELLR